VADMTTILYHDISKYFLIT